ncbi:hypothetical protein Tco_0038899 [Tanacetum coccineum]
MLAIACKLGDSADDQTAAKMHCCEDYNRGHTQHLTYPPPISLLETVTGYPGLTLNLALGKLDYSSSVPPPRTTYPASTDFEFLSVPFIEPVIFGPLPRPANYIAPEDIDNLNSMEDDTILGGFHEETHAGPDDAPTTTADAAGRAEDPALLTSLSAKIDRCMGRIDLLETELGTSKKIMGGAILTLVSRVKKLERTVKQLRSARLVGDAPATEGDVDIQDEVDLEGLSRMASDALGHDQATVPSELWEEFERRRFLLGFHAPRSTDVLPQADISESAGPSVGADKGKAPMPDLEIPAEFLAEDAQARQRLEEEQATSCKELDEPCSLMTDTDCVDVDESKIGTNPSLAHEQSESTNDAYLVKNQWCAAHNGTITMKAVKAMSKQQLIEEYENICRCLEKDRLLSAQYNLFRPKPAIQLMPSAKRQTVFSLLDSATLPMSWFFLLFLDTTLFDESFVVPVDTTDSDDSSSPSPVSTDHVPIDVLVEPTQGGINLCYLVLVVVVCGTNSQMIEIVDDPRAKVEPISESCLFTTLSSIHGSKTSCGAK